MLTIAEQFVVMAFDSYSLAWLNRQGFDRYDEACKAAIDLNDAWGKNEEGREVIVTVTDNRNGRELLRLP